MIIAPAQSLTLGGTEKMAGAAEFGGSDPTARLVHAFFISFSKGSLTTMLAVMAVPTFPGEEFR